MAFATLKICQKEKINDHHTQNNRIHYLLDWSGVYRDWDAGCGAGGRIIVGEGIV